ncbi:MAG: hypothetical protein P8Y63_12795, partial [Deltaproteobacteria bacterium]
ALGHGFPPWAVFSSALYCVYLLCQQLSRSGDLVATALVAKPFVIFPGWIPPDFYLSPFFRISEFPKNNPVKSPILAFFAT